MEVPIDFDDLSTQINIINGDATITDTMVSDNMECSYPDDCKFSYEHNVDTSVCETISVTNTATLTAGLVKLSATTVVDINVEGGSCGGDGCTYTIGYWRTHTKYGPAKKRDSVWDTLGEDTTFHKSGQSYYTVINSSSAGGAYYTLARQFIAATLNINAGASLPLNVKQAITDSTILFQNYTPSEVKKSKTITNTFISYVGLLTSYNEGVIGPGHCFE